MTPANDTLPAPRTLAAHFHLVLLQKRIRSCTACPLHEHRQRAVFSRGNHHADVMFVGEAPGADEDQQGLPFVGPSGEMLDRMIGAMGLRQEEVYIANVCRCRPPANRLPTPEEVAACLPYLHEQIALVQPRVLVALGSTAAKALTQSTSGIKALRGTWQDYRRGETVVPVMPTYHPAFLLRETLAGRVGAKQDAWRDLQAVLTLLNRPVPTAKEARS